MKKIFTITFIFLLLTAFLYLFIGNISNAQTSSHQKPKILFTNFHPHTSGGHLHFILSIIQSNLRDQFEFAVAVPETSDIFKACIKLGITTYPCDFPGKFKELPQMITASRSLRKILKEYSPDIIHSNGGHDTTLTVWNSFLLGKKTPIIRTFHGTKIVGKDPYHWLLNNQLIAANMFVSTSAFKLNAQNGGLTLKNVYIIENAVDLEKFKPTPKDHLLKEQLGIPQDYFVFGSSAGLSDYKRVDLMVDALTLFPPSSPFRVIVLGHDPQNLIEKAKSVGVDHFLIFPGYLENVRPICSIFDVGFILSTRVETSSFASREMMAMGIPLISSSYSGLKDNIEDHINGIFIEPGNVRDIYNAMNFFLKMPTSELETYKKNARLKAKRAFDQNIQLKAIGNLYSDLLNKKTTKEISYLLKYKPTIQKAINLQVA